MAESKVDSRTLTVSELGRLAELYECVQAGKPITRLFEGRTVWMISRAFTHDGGGFLGAGDDVRDGYVWMSGGSSFMEQWWPVSELLAGLEDGSVVLDYRP